MGPTACHLPLTPPQLAAGGTHTMALTSGARIFIWGRGSFGRLGMAADTRDMYHPVEVGHWVGRGMQ